MRKILTSSTMDTHTVATGTYRVVEVKGKENHAEENLEEKPEKKEEVLERNVEIVHLSFPCKYLKVLGLCSQAPDAARSIARSAHPIPQGAGGSVAKHQMLSAL